MFTYTDEFTKLRAWPLTPRFETPYIYSVAYQSKNSAFHSYSCNFKGETFTQTIKILLLRGTYLTRFGLVGNAVAPVFVLFPWRTGVVRHSSLWQHSYWAWFSPPLSPYCPCRRVYGECDFQVLPGKRMLNDKWLRVFLGKGDWGEREREKRRPNSWKTCLMANKDEAYEQAHVWGAQAREEFSRPSSPDSTLPGCFAADSWPLAPLLPG